MTLTISKAVKYGAKLRLALYGPSGSGKTYSSLKMAMELAGNGRVLVIDSERGSASKYADQFDFDVIELTDFHPSTYVEAINLAARSKEHTVLVIDSITQEWNGQRGALELVGGDFTEWKKVTPLHNAFINAMLDLNKHLIVTMRAKEGHSMEKEEGKRAVIKKIGMEPIQRGEIQYEFDVVGLLDSENIMDIVKTRCSDLQGVSFPKPGKEFVDVITPWLEGSPRIITSDRLNKLYARGKKSAIWATPEEFADEVRRLLQSDIPVSIKDMTTDQARDIEAEVANRERQSKAS